MNVIFLTDNVDFGLIAWSHDWTKLFATMPDAVINLGHLGIHAGTHML